MWKKKRGSTLVMVLCVFGFVIIIGMGVLTLAGVANQQASRTFGQEQADFAAQSILDTVSEQIMDGMIDPFALGTGPTHKLTGGGEDDTLGKYDIQIEETKANVFRLAVTAERSGFTSSMYNLLQYTTGDSGHIDLKNLFDVVAGATGLNPGVSGLPSTPGSSEVIGSVFFDNKDAATVFAGGKGVTKNVDAIGSLAVSNGDYGTGADDTHLQSNGDIRLTTGGTVASAIRSEKNVTVEQSQKVTGDIYANGDVTIKNGAVVSGDIHAGGTVTLDGWGVKVNGKIYANGTKNPDGTFLGGDIVVKNGAVVDGDIYANGMLTAEGDSVILRGTAYVNGDVTIQNEASVNSIKSNGNVTVKNSLYGSGTVGSIDCMGNLDFLGKATLELRANGTGKLVGTFGKNVYINGDVEIGQILNIKEVYSNGTIHFKNASVGNSVFPSFYAPKITGEDSDISYCNLYVKGKPGTIEMTNCISYAATGSLLAEVYADGDITFTNCNRWPGLELIKVYSNGNVTFNNSRVAGLYGSKSNIRMWGGVSIQGGSMTGTIIEAGGDIECSGATVGAQMSTNRSIYFKDSTVQRETYLCNEDMVVEGTSTFNAQLNIGRDFYMQMTKGTARSVGFPVVVNGSVIFENANLSGNLDAIRGGSITDSTVSGTIRMGAAPTNSGSTITGLTVVDPALITPVTLFSRVEQMDVPIGIGMQTAEKIDIPYDDMPIVDLKLQEKYANLEEWKMPAAIEQQVKQNNVTLYFNKEEPGYVVEDKDYIVSSNCTLSVDFQRGGGNIYGKRLVFDATKGDLYIRLKSADEEDDTFAVPNGVQILTKGDHNVYLFVDEGTGSNDYTNFKLSGNTFMGYYDYLSGGAPADDTHTPNLFLISNAKGVMMDISGYNSAYAFFYAPYGTVKMDGSSLFSSNVKLYGSAIASHIEMGSPKYVQYAPNGEIGGGTEISGWTVIGTYYGTGE